MKTFTTFLLLLVVMLGFQLYRQHATIREQQSRLVDLQRQIAANSTPKTALEYQEKCAEQARKAFVGTGYKLEQGAGYENHYSTELKRCFILTQSTDAKNSPTIWTYKFLSDAYEGKSYGEYAWRTVKHMKYWEVPPVTCRVVLPSGEEHICKSDEEFGELIKVYMEDR
jgi:hypothetical protein